MFVGAEDALRLDGDRAAGQIEDRTIVLARTKPQIGPRAVAAVRPEQMTIAAAPNNTGHNAIACRVEDATYLGAVTRYHLKTRTGASIAVSMPTVATPPFAHRADVWVSWPIEQGFLLPHQT